MFVAKEEAIEKSWATMGKRARASKRAKSSTHLQSLIHDTTSIIPPLPQDIVVEILSKLPLKLLLQFKCVSKPWLALISSPEFAKAHLHSSLNNKNCSHHRVLLAFRSNFKVCSLSSLLYSPRLTKACNIDYPKKNAYPFSVSPVGSVNGLILVTACKRPRGLPERPMFPGSGTDLYICNPSIRKSKLLPPIGIRVSSYRCSFGYGFGYDVLHDDYKVVFIYDISPDDGHRCESKIKIYSLKNDSWRTDCQKDSLVDSESRSKYVNGKLYWMADMDCGIVTFGLADETWGKLELPISGKQHRFRLEVSRSDLFVLYGQGAHSDVWVMKDCGAEVSWTKMFTIKNRTDIVSHRVEYVPYELFWVSNDGESLLLFWTSFMIYNPNDGSFKKRKTDIDTCYETKEIYVESLVNPFLYS